MIRRSALILLEVTAGILAIGALAAGAAAWRLQQGPLEVEWLTPYVEQAINQDAPVDVTIDRTVLSWDGFGAPLNVRALGITALGESGLPLAAVPEAKIAFSLPALLQARMAPARIELVAPRLSAVRTEDGAFTLDMRASDIPADPEAGARILGRLVDALRRPPDPTDPLGALTELRITGASLTVENRQNGANWMAPAFDLVLVRDDAGIRGSAEAELDLGGRLNHIAADIAYRSADGGLGLTALLQDVRPADFGDLAPVLEPLKALDVAFGGTVTLDLGADLAPQGLAIDLTGGGGTLNLPDRLPEPVTVEEVVLRGRLDDAGRHLSLEEFRLDLGRPTATVTGDVRQVDGSLSVGLRATLTDMPMAELPRYWPLGVTPNTRDWMVANMADGMFDRTVFELDGSTPVESPLDLTVERIAASFDLSGFTLHYRKPLPPLTQVAATATLDGRTIDIRISDGTLFDLTATDGRVRILGLDQPDQSIDIRVGLDGPLSTALTVLDHDPLGYASRINLVPETVSGHAAIQLQFAFPLVKDLRMEDVDLLATARVTDAAVPDIVADIDVTDGILDLTVDGDDLTMSGVAKLNGVPAVVTWEEWFPDEAPLGTRIRVQAMPDDAERARFNLDFPEWINGKAAVDLTYLRPRGEPQRIEATLDLLPATLRIELMDWEKPPGQPGQADLTVLFEESRPVYIPRFTIRTEELSADGRLRLWPEDYELKRLVLERFRLGETTDTRLELTRTRDGTLTIAAEGAAFDVRPFKSGSDTEATEPPQTEPDANAPPEPPMDLIFTIARATMGDEGQAVAGVTGTASRRNGRWERANVDATVGDGQPLKLRYWPQSGSLMLTVESGDAGAALRDLGLLDYVRGGKLMVTGRSDPGDPTRTVAGTLEVTDYRVQDAPVLARLLSAASPRGFADFLSGSPLSFDRLEGQFFWHDRGISFRDLRTSGNAVGITLEGDIDAVAGSADLQGTVVPFSAVNRLLGVIPLVGDILTGGEGQGVFAATYSVEGPLGDLDVGVNPLAMLTPGFLRNLFFLGEPAGEERTVPTGQPLPGQGDGAAMALPPDPGAVATTPAPPPAVIPPEAAATQDIREDMAAPPRSEAASPPAPSTKPQPPPSAPPAAGSPSP